MHVSRSTAVLLALAVTGAVVLSALGTWQFMRNGYKHDLVRELDARVAAAPLSSRRGRLDVHTTTSTIAAWRSSASGTTNGCR